MTKHIGILLFPEVEELDAIGPWEVLAWWTNAFPEDGYTVTCLARESGPVECAKGLTVHAHHGFDDAPTYDVLVHPGGSGTGALRSDEAHLDWLRRMRKKVPLMTSVCSGSLVFAAAGLLRNRPATTYWSQLDRLAELDPTIEVRHDDRFVDDGDVMTSAGISAGIDMALHLVSRLAGDERARQVRRGIQYDPAPPV
ncbi:DJ-1/PfpI family protein [Jiangella endophytica]|uniref:DJ-1/PfpI family protein n=1 Tax=Jiangella endophytica TaxID=1623398 RepID=UPI000E349F01|nr:DJ-1/PfpI family protein [Jiangella endophytica]